jgi:hypothetical protein
VSKLKIIFSIIILAVVICLADNIFSKQEYLKGIITSKTYKNKMTFKAVGNNSKRGHTVINEPTYDPNGYIFIIKEKDNNEIAIRSNYDIYLTAHRGDSVKYRLSKGLFSKKVWNASIIEVIPNLENRKKMKRKTPIPFEELFKL